MSTGPRSAAGKRRASRNSFKHGLSLPLHTWSDRIAEELEELARDLAGEAPAPGKLDDARRLAEALLDLARIREVKRMILNRAISFGDLELLPPTGSIKLENWCFHGSSHMTIDVAAYLGPKKRISRRYSISDPDEILELADSLQEADHRGAVLRAKHFIASMPKEESRRTLEGIRRAIPELIKLERYERRACARRDCCIRELLADPTGTSPNRSALG